MTKRFERIYEDVDVFCRDHNAKGLSQLIERDDYDKVVDLLNELHEENKQLQHDATILIQSNQDYRKENEQLKQRNDRQAKQLDRLYNLIEQNDWRTLNDILDDFKQCEEQLQQEWKCYE